MISKPQCSNRIVLFCFFIFLFLSINLRVNAAPSGQPLTTYPNAHLVSLTDLTSDKEIPEEYATVMRPSSELTYTVSGNSGVSGNENSTSRYYSFNQSAIKSGTRSYLQANNVAIYKGNIIDVRMNIRPESTATYVYLYAPSYAPNKNMENFLRLDVANAGKYALIDYEFYIHGTNQKIDFSANWNYAWINDYKAITQPSDQIKDVYTYDIQPNANPKPLYYDTNFIPGNNLTVYGKNSSQNFISANAYSVLFDTTNGVLHQRIDSLKYRSWTKYSAQPITKMNLPSPQIIGETTDYSDIKFTMNQDINTQLKPSFYPKEYTMYVRLKNANVMDWDNTNMTTTDVTGVNNSQINNYFNVKKDKNSNQLTINVSENTFKNTDFVNNSYFFKVNGKINNSSAIDQYYQSDGYYHVPVYVQYETDTNTSVENKAYAKIRAKLSGETKLQTVPQGSSTKDWSEYKVSDLFSGYRTPLTGEKVSISNIESVTFKDLKDYFVKVTLKAEKTGITETFNVPVKVKAKKTATINFIDENGVKVSDPITKIGFEEEAYDYSNEIKELAGYKFLKVDDRKDFFPIKGNYPSATGNNNVIINIIYSLSQSQMTVKQVYKTKLSQAIYKNIDNQETVNNKGKTYNETIGASIPDIIDQMKKNSKDEVNIDYNWYLPIDTTKDFIVLVDGKEVDTNKVPDEDFELLITYTGITNLKVSDLNYGQIPITGKDNTVFNNPNSTQKITVLNTDISDNWNLVVSESDSIKNDRTSERYLGGLFIEKDGVPTIIDSSGVKFATQADQTNVLISKIPMDIKLFQNMGNSLDSYKGEVLWSIQNTP